MPDTARDRVATTDDVAGIFGSAFRADAAAGLDVTFALMWHDEQRETGLVYRIRDCVLTRLDPDADDAHPDLTCLFSDSSTAVGIVTGKANPIDAFMAGEFSSDGYLTLVFTVLQAFR